MTRRRYGFYRCTLCAEWFEASLCGQVGSYDVCHACIAYLHETVDSDHPPGGWDVERALEAAVEAAGRALVAEGARRRYAGWHEHATREA